MGTPGAAVPTLQRCLQDGHEVVAVWTQPDKPSGRGKKISFSPVKEFALAHNLTVHQPARIKNEEALKLFASPEAELAVVVAYGRILPGEFLRTPRRGCVNVHFSLLPFYRGAAPVNWAIVNGDTETGVTTMFIEETLDSGPILLQQKTEIGGGETAPQLMQRLSLMGADLLSETLIRLPQITPRPQLDRDATFAPMLTKEDGRIDWSKTSIEIAQAVRGLQPWPNAYTSIKSRGLTVWDAEPLKATETNVAPGEIVAARGDELIVKCGGETTLRLLELQPEAKRRMSVRDFLNGVHLKVGDRFGES
jgi:methionyl-tRNA formyltransferase